MHNLYCGVVVDKVQSLGDSAIGDLLNASKFSPDWLET